jgi:hypothetical protein
MMGPIPYQKQPANLETRLRDLWSGMVACTPYREVNAVNHGLSQSR